MGVSRVVSILILAVFGFSLGSDFFSSHDMTSSCGTGQTSLSSPLAEGQGATLISESGCSEESKKEDCSDPCHLGYCHFGHCFHVTVTATHLIKAPPILSAFGKRPNGYIPSQYPPSIFRPPIS